MKYVISPAVQRNQIFAEKISYIKKYLPGKFASGNFLFAVRFWQTLNLS